MGSDVVFSSLYLDRSNSVVFGLPGSFMDPHGLARSSLTGYSSRRGHDRYLTEPLRSTQPGPRFSALGCHHASPSGRLPEPSLSSRLGFQSHYCPLVLAFRAITIFSLAFRAFITFQFWRSEPSLFSVWHSEPLSLFSLAFEPSSLFSFGVQSHRRFSVLAFRAITIFSLAFRAITIFSLAFRAIIAFQFGIQSHRRFSVLAFRARAIITTSPVLVFKAITSWFRRSEPSLSLLVLSLAFRAITTSQYRRSEPSSSFLSLGIRSHRYHSSV
ncbi:hypothetical protein VitviT2T_004197 [Vitis vinifera]|uniref:Uncharacterized protein n=1 Tax=Vitis vinifera TaxID=29760 RepID=A0ABY9BNS1_VITVI|nr:hypothetical protein VitviT2T_004197 [Vitis vinifera]